MDVREIRAMSDEAILDALEDQKEALFNLRLQKASNQLEDANALRRARRVVARLLTVQRERADATADGTARETKGQA